MAFVRADQLIRVKPTGKSDTDLRQVFLGELLLGTVSADGRQVQLDADVAQRIAHAQYETLREHFHQQPVAEETAA